MSRRIQSPLKLDSDFLSICEQEDNAFPRETDRRPMSEQEMNRVIPHYVSASVSFTFKLIHNTKRSC
ncbi:hypothetical protein CesoFtcFv8_023839 [Champsocephalus esox]|uniref:Uncharacterized protein n=1 Tax=Champsocephalus esox TaxID=159716 RepID=A0AAN8B4K9_9TELE|nr:hypothetical protein CesoFtcFv8_023839 [Champsocephalus esox]